MRKVPGVVDVVVSETHACVTFDPRGPIPDLSTALDVAARPMAREPGRLEIVQIRYDGPDLDAVATFAGLSVEEAIALHLSRTYEVRAVGFLPGFAYLGDTDPRIAAPRLPNPRPRVPARSVGIAGDRTGIYPFASPGGWQLVGTAIDFEPFDPDSGARLRLGDRVRFVRV
nr:carboxyltransferase domain-containing protein [Vulgatibacter incomptus]